MRRHRVLAALLVAIPLWAAAQEEEPPPFENQALLDIVAMAEANVAVDVMLARVDQIGEFPVLDGRDLAELKRRGVSDKVLLRMIELSTPEEAATPTRENVEPEEPVVPLPEGAAEIEVKVRRPFPVTYFEVAVDSRLVHTEGWIWQGSAEGEHHLKRPFPTRGPDPVTAFSSPVDPGSYAVKVGFAVSQVKGDPGTEWGEWAGEEYVTRGMRAIGEPLPGEAPSGNVGAECSVRAGQVCRVMVTFARTSPTSLGGMPIYSVRYRSEVDERR